MDDIINIDECLSDSFSLSSDTDIRNIVDQWKHSDSGTVNKEQKYVDTRTFTRPKKKIFSHLDANHGIGASRNRLSSGSDALAEETMTSSTSSTEPPPQPQIDLKIGGLVTSLQRSFLGDVSPPPTVLMESSIELMGNSLITSSDFSNINEFINANEDSLSLAQFKNYRLSDAINDRNFLERLTNYDDSLFTKDADINNIDGNNLFAQTNGGDNFSGNSTLQNSTDSSSNLGKNNETFVPSKNGNATFNTSNSGADGSESNGTFIQNNATNVTNRNETFDAVSAMGADATFDALRTKGMAAMHIDTMDMLDNEEMSLQGSFNDFQKPEGYGNATINLEDDICSPLQSATTTKPIPTDAYQSTPARKDFAKKSRRSESLANISPILCDDLKMNRNQMQNVDKFVDVEIDVYPVFLRNTSKSDSRASNPLALMNLREEERQSLKNFEDFENTLLMLENNKNEDEFDDLLNSIGGNAGKSQKVRQSLDIIKKRHSLINMEKQYQDELNREKSVNSIRGEQLASDRSKIIDSFSKSPAMVSSTSSSASSSGERLLRRSRLYDDVISTSGNQLNTSGSSISSNDNRQTAMESDAATESLNRKNQSYLTRDNVKTDQQTNHYNIEDSATSNGDTKANNRDRFKTIRIFKKPPENAVQVLPNADATNETVTMYAGIQSIDHFTQKNTNSPQSMAEAKAINTMTFKKSALARPKYLGGIQKRDAYTKSSSHEILSNDSYDHAVNQAQATKTPPLKSPMGVKSKSVHSLLTSNKMSSGMSRPLATTSTSAHNTATFKIPKPLAALRQPMATGNRKIGLIRPSSGYYSYNVKRLDSDSESGKFSSNNSLSSGSSKGSLNRSEYESTMNSTFATNSNPNSTFALAPVSQMNVPHEQTSKLTNGIGGNISRPTGLRQPSQIRRSALPRPMTIPKR